METIPQERKCATCKTSQPLDQVHFRCNHGYFERVCRTCRQTDGKSTYYKRKSSRRCVVCGLAAPRPKSVICQPCMDKSVVNNRTAKQKRYNEGLCWRCSEPHLPGRKSC